MCGSRKYPYPHHRGNWKFQGSKTQEILEGKGLENQFSFQMSFDSKWIGIDIAVQKSFLTNFHMENTIFTRV